MVECCLEVFSIDGSFPFRVYLEAVSGMQQLQFIQVGTKMIIQLGSTRRNAPSPHRTRYVGAI